MQTPQKSVMIIEDEPDAADLFAEMMRLNGYRVMTAYSGAPAMALMAQHKPDIIIMDVMMPNVSGLDVLQQMRSDPGFASIPVVIVSARASPADITTGLEAGASIYLTKPVAYGDLKNAVDNLVKAP